MRDLQPGGLLLVLATDSEAPIDLAAWATDEGHTFRDLSSASGSGGAGWLTLELRKAA